MLLLDPELAPVFAFSFHSVFFCRDVMMLLSLVASFDECLPTLTAFHCIWVQGDEITINRKGIRLQ